MEKKFIKVSASGYNIPKRCRKPVRYNFEIARLNTLEEVTDAAIEMLTEEAKKQLIKFSNVQSISLLFNEAREDNDMVMVAIMPVKSVKIL